MTYNRAQQIDLSLPPKKMLFICSCYLASLLSINASVFRDQEKNIPFSKYDV